MTTTNISIRLDENLRAEATQILADYGLSPTQAIKLFFNQIVSTRKVPLSFDYQATEKKPTAKLLNAIAELENGETTTYESIDDFVKAFK
ncbi:MAG: type II toxin-antitoxin system RelB/DinJ family antitoxin [Neisseriaceae bacterium]|nr:type II toxin-antitoxin system RelB/DinJ family antitoxin [Neisseriaceae bacterium]